MNFVVFEAPTKILSLKISYTCNYGSYDIIVLLACTPNVCSWYIEAYSYSIALTKPCGPFQGNVACEPVIREER